MLKKVNNLTWQMGGKAGEGIMAAGLMFAKCMARFGLNAYTYTEYPSLIRGGHNVYWVSVSDKEKFFVDKKIDLLVAMDEETVEKHKADLSLNAGLIYNSENFSLKAGNFKNIKLFPVPLKSLAKNPLMENVVALGASLGILGGDFAILKSVIADMFQGKKQEIIDANIVVARAGYDFVKNNFKNSLNEGDPPEADRLQVGLKRVKEGDIPKCRFVINGNEAAALGAVMAGCKFFIAYPMTPASSILHFLKAHQDDFNMLVHQSEDEISAIGMAIGASYAGVRAATCTSGGGFALKVEHLGLAGMTETPLVVFMSQRPGPSTGMPTWTEQADLKFLINSAQGEFPRLIIAPGDAVEAFNLTVQSFNLADQYQIPVIVLLDKLISENGQTITTDDFKKVKINRGKLLAESDLSKLQNYSRYKFTSDGVSPRTLPGFKKGIFDANSDEHDEQGFSTENSLLRTKMMDKRMKKLKSLEKELIGPKLYGEKKAYITLISWGSTKAPILEAMKLLKEQGMKVNFLHFTYLWPLPKANFLKLISDAKKTMILENNATGQFASLLKEQTGFSADEVFLKYDGRPFWAEKICEKVINELGVAN